MKKERVDFEKMGRKELSAYFNKFRGKGESLSPEASSFVQGYVRKGIRAYYNEADKPAEQKDPQCMGGLMHEAYLREKLYHDLYFFKSCGFDEQNLSSVYREALEDMGYYDYEAEKNKAEAEKKRKKYCFEFDDLECGSCNEESADKEF